MRFSRIILAAFVAIASAQTADPNAFNEPTSNYLLSAGKSQQFTWRNKAGSTVTIKLRSGPSGDLGQGKTIADHITNDGSFTWNVPSDIVEGADYTLEIINDDDPSETNYTTQFVIQSPNKAVPTSSGAASSTASAASSSASAASSSASASASSSSASASASSSSASAASASSSSASASASASNSSASSSASATSDSASSASATTSQTVATDNAAPMVKVGGSLFAVAAGFAWAL